VTPAALPPGRHIQPPCEASASSSIPSCSWPASGSIPAAAGTDPTKTRICINDEKEVVVSARQDRRDYALLQSADCGDT
jgi:hypothetical protein